MTFLLWIFVSPVIGYAIGKSRNCPAIGALLVYSGPLGWLLAFLNDRREQCSQCRVSARRRRALPALRIRLASPAA